MRIILAFALAACLLAPAAASAHGLCEEVDIELQSFYATPSLNQVEDAIAEAAAEFAVPATILEVIAHTESRWQHVPWRVSHDGRRGLFQLSEDHQLTAAALLGVDLEEVRANVYTHARGFAALLDDSRPVTKTGNDTSVGLWREAIAWSMDFEPTAADQLVDHYMALMDDGVITRLADGSPIAIAPVPVADGALGVFAAAMAERTGPGADAPGVIYNPTPCNHTADSRGLNDVDTVVIHTIQGSYSGAINWMHNCSANVSAHYTIRSSDGQVTQTLDEEDVGWHAGDWTTNLESIGIEHEGYVAEPAVWYTDAMYAGSAAITADILADYNIPADRNHVIGHFEVPGCSNPLGGGTSCHTDPGSGWDWAYYMDLVGGTVVVDATSLVGYIRHTDLFNVDFGISGATVSIAGVGTATTDGAGFYSFDPIDPGTYQICATAAGYDEGCRDKTVQAAITNWGSIQLDAAVVGDDDDDATGDDDDTADDDDTGDDDDTSNDDDTADDDDDTSNDDDTADDDDTANDDDDDDTANDDDDSQPVVIGGTRRDVGSSARDSRGAGCAASQVGAGERVPLAALLVVLLGVAGLLRRRL